MEMIVVMDLKEDNEALLERVSWLEKVLEDRQISVLREESVSTSE